MESPKHLSFFATKSMGSLRMDTATASQKHQRRAHRVLPGPDGRATIISNGGGTTRESIHSRWSSNASTVREAFVIEDRASRRASEYHIKTFAPIVDVVKADDDENRAGELRSSHVLYKTRRWTRANLEGEHDSAPELPLLRISSFPDMMAAGLSSCSPDISTPASISDSFTVSDSSSSFQGMLGFASEFPQPPSLSPTLRRMQSAPWLKDQNANPDSLTTDNYSWRRMSHATERSQDVDLYFPCSGPDVQSFSRDNFDSAEMSYLLEKSRRQRKALDLEQVEKGSPLDRLREETKTAGGNLSWSRRHAYKTRTTDDLLEALSQKAPDPSQLLDTGGQIQARAAKNRDGRRNTVSSTPDASLTENPRTIRKVASMQSQVQGKPFPENTGQRTIPKIRSLRLFPPHSYSKHDPQNDPAKPRNWLSLRSSTLGKFPTSKSEGAHLGGASVGGGIGGAGASAGKKAPRGNRTPYPHQAEQTNRRASNIFANTRRESAKPRVSGLGFANFEPLVTSKSSIGLGLESTRASGVGGVRQGLDRPFTLQKSKSPGSQLERREQGVEDPERSQVYNNTSVDTSTSFMDITPERAVKAEKPATAAERKDRVRKFIAKASNGILVWGRGLTAKKVHTP